MVSDEIHSKEINGRIKSVCIRSDSMKGDKKNWQIQQLSGSWLCGIFEWEEISSVTLWKWRAFTMCTGISDAIKSHANTICFPPFAIVILWLRR